MFPWATRTMSGNSMQIDTLGITGWRTRRGPDEIVVIVALADGGPSAPRASPSQALWLRHAAKVRFRGCCILRDGRRS